mgnify:CR=1 FL=1
MNRVIIIDSEKTGENVKQDEILQLTILSDAGDVLFNEYFRPEKESWPEAEQRHHITPDMVKDCATLAEHKKTIQMLLDSADTIVGYNQSVDMAFLKAAGIRYDQKKNYDLMLEFSQLMGEWDRENNAYKWYDLKECADYFGYHWGADAPDNSSSDCRAILYCYKKILAGETKEGGRKNRKQHPSAFRGGAPGKGLTLRSLLSMIAAVVVLCAAVFAVRSFRAPKKERRTTVTASALQQVLNISDLSTVEFRYGSVTQALDDKQKTKYYVTYNGTVQVGIDFEEIAKSIAVDTEEKTITVTMPPPKILSTNVNVDTLDYIFVKNKYNQTGLTEEALQLCREDLSNELEHNTEIFSIAKENAESAVRQLLEPWLKQADGEYTIVMKQGVDRG